MGYSRTSSIYNTTRREREDFEENPPSVHLEVTHVKDDSGGTDGEITVKGISPDLSATAFDFDLDEAGTWADSNVTEKAYTGLSAGLHIIQARDNATPANVSQKIYVEV